MSKLKFHKDAFALVWPTKEQIKNTQVVIFGTGRMMSIQELAEDILVCDCVRTCMRCLTRLEVIRRKHECSGLY